MDYVTGVDTRLRMFVLEWFFHPFAAAGLFLGYIFVCVPNPFLNYLGATVEAVLRS